MIVLVSHWAIVPFGAFKYSNQMCLCGLELQILLMHVYTHEYHAVLSIKNLLTRSHQHIFCECVCFFSRLKLSFGFTYVVCLIFLINKCLASCRVDSMFSHAGRSWREWCSYTKSTKHISNFGVCRLNEAIQWFWLWFLLSLSVYVLDVRFAFDSPLSHLNPNEV